MGTFKVTVFVHKKLLKLDETISSQTESPEIVSQCLIVLASTGEAKVTTDRQTIKIKEFLVDTKPILIGLSFLKRCNIRIEKTLLKDLSC